MKPDACGRMEGVIRHMVNLVSYGKKKMEWHEEKHEHQKWMALPDQRNQEPLEPDDSSPTPRVHAEQPSCASIYHVY